MANYKNFVKTITPPLFFIAAAHYLLTTGLLPSFPVFNTSLLIFVLFAIALILTVVFDRSRFFLSLLFALSLFTINFRGGFPPDFQKSPLLFFLLVIFWGNLFLLAISREKGIISPPGKTRIFIILIQIIGFPLLIFPNQDWLDKVYFELLVAIGNISPFNLLLALTGFGFFCFCAVGYIRKDSTSVTLGAIWVASFSPFLYPPSDPVWLVFYLALIAFVFFRLLFDLYTLAYLDELTRLPSRRSLQQDFLKLPSPFSIAMVDIDHFKRVNDRYGHATGDQVLKFVAALLQKHSGPGKPYRFGGEEFAIIFPGQSRDEVLPHLKELREKMIQRPFYVRGKKRPRKKPGKKPRNQGNKIKVTASFGLADNEILPTPAEVIKAADKALYRAKNKGRDRIETTR